MFVNEILRDKVPELITRQKESAGNHHVTHEVLELTLRDRKERAGTHHVTERKGRKTSRDRNQVPKLTTRQKERAGTHHVTETKCR